MAAVFLAVGQTMMSAVALAATTCPAAGCVYIVKGTNSTFNQIPDSAYPQFAYTYDRAVGAPAPTPVTTPYPYYLVPYPASFWPITPPGYIFSPTFDQSVATGVNNLEALRPVSTNSSTDVIWGYSQGATVVTFYKRDYNAQPNPPAKAPTFVLVANPNRPNGGILERGVALGTIPVLGVTFSGATPTNTAGQPAGKITTYDIARQYDGIADAPVNPLNVVADANAIMGFYYLHGMYPSADPTTAVNQGTFGDTQYYLIPTYPLPLLMPLESIPVIGFPLADTLDPPLRVIVESGYDRTTSPGVPTPFNPLYFPNPVTFGTNLVTAIPVGLDNGISDFTGTRPFGTVRPGPFGVGGPSPTPTPTPVTTPTIPVLFGSPEGGFFALLDPTTLLSDLSTFPQLSSILNGGLPVGIPSLLGSPGQGTLINPLNTLPNPGSGPGQSTTAATNVLPAVVSSPRGRSPSTAPQSVSPTTESDTTADAGLGRPWTPKQPDNSNLVQGSTTNALPKQQPSDDTQSTDDNSGPRLNVSRPSSSATPGGSQSGSSSTNGGSPPRVANPVGTAISNVTNSINSTLGGPSNSASGGVSGKKK